MISIFAFLSYRKFIAAYLEEQRNYSPTINQAKLAKKLGVGASSLKMIQSGARNLTVHNIHTFAHGMGLNPSEHEYFEALVHYEQAENAAEKRFYQKRLKTTKEASSKSTRVNFQDLLKEWYMPAILVHLIDGNGVLDADRISQKLGISKARVQETVDTLKKLGVFTENQGGKIHFVMDKFTPHFSKQIYLKKLIPVLQKKIESEFHSPSSYFETHAISLSEAQFRGFLEDHKLLVERYLSQDTTASTTVYQLFTAAFPVL